MCSLRVLGFHALVGSNPRCKNNIDQLGSAPVCGQGAFKIYVGLRKALCSLFWGLSYIGLYIAQMVLYKAL